MNESVKRTENFDKNSSNDGHYFYGLYGLFGLCWSIFGQQNMLGGGGWKGKRKVAAGTGHWDGACCMCSGLRHLMFPFPPLV